MSVARRPSPTGLPCFICLFVFLHTAGIMTDPITRITEQAAAAAPGFDRPTGPPHQARSVVVARHGIVATSHPLAAEAGLDILKAGGNAADAAIAVNAMLGVVEPMSCGIGGDMFAIYWDNATGKLYGLNASGRSPLKISRQLFADRQIDQIPLEGLLSWSIPGCVSGWSELNGRFGSRPLKQLLAASIQTADEGFPVTEVIASYWKSAETPLANWPDSASTFLVDGKRAPRFGEIFANPRLARSYQLIAEQGPEAFYRGSIAKRIVAFSEQNDGLLSMKDFRSHRAEWVEPVSTSYRGYDVWELPPNGQGIAALEMLNVLQQHDVASMGPGSADFIHLLVEAKKLAFADRARYYADPAFGDLPTEALISKEYGIEQNKRIDMKRAADDVPAGDPQLQKGDTVYLTVIDKDRNCCSFIQSNYYGFGSKVTPADVGFAMQNRGALFALDDQHLNRLEPGKRPFHTIIPAMVTRDGKPIFCFGVMGGDMQPQGHVQLLVNVIDFGMNVQAAGDAARVRHVGSASPTGLAAKGVGVVTVESGIAEQVIEQLTSRGHKVERSGSGFGGYQGILIDHENGVLHGATESRKDGAAVGY
jgi:gamma-glutamyltranspeptidase/glutathione hydrolase